MLEPGSISTREIILLKPDPMTGVQVTQHTSAPGIHINIYGEVPYMDASSRWFMLMKSTTSWGVNEIWRADLERGFLEWVCDGVANIRSSARSPDQRYFFCQRTADDGTWEILRTEIATLEQRVFPLEGAPLPRSMGTVGPDGNTFMYSTMFAVHDYGVVRCDLEGESWEVIHRDTEISNAHPQLEPGRGEICLIQHNRGCQYDEQARTIRSVGPEGATLYIIDATTGEKQELPIGRPHTGPCQGHQCWIGDTGEVMFAVSLDSPDQVHDVGNLLRIRPGDEQARVVASGYYFMHPSASLDGRFFVSDVRDADGVLLVVGCVETGNTRVLCDSRATLGAPQYTHPHPYFSPDCRWVIFNSDGTGVPHVCAARVPEGFLEELAD